jgi:carbamate kinase
MLLLLTDVDAVELRWGTSEARKIRSATPPALRRERFAEGSMGPKVEAACRFVEATGRSAAIGSLEDAPEIVRGLAGTTVTPGDAPSMSFWDESVPPVHGRVGQPVPPM